MPDFLEYFFNELRLRGVSVYQFSKQTGIPRDRIYKWKQQGTTPKAADLEAVREWMGDKYPTVKEPDTTYGEHAPDYQAKYIRLLETTKETLESVLKVNLTAMTESQMHLRALSVTQLNQLARLRATAEKKQLSKVQAEINKEVADAVLAGLETGIPEGIQGKG